MAAIDFILNLAGLLLWLNWRSLRFDPLAHTTPATLVGTLRPAHPRRLKSWFYLLGAALLLLLRAVLYGQLAPAVNWTPKLELGLIVPAFRSDVFGSALLFCTLSQVRVLVIFYFWLVFLAMIDRGGGEPDALQKLLRLHVGRIGRWPWYVQLALPCVVIALLWMAAYGPMVHAGVINRTTSQERFLAQGLLVAASVFLTLKYVLPVILLLHLVSSYVYLGSSPLWTFIANTAGNILAPLQRLPLRFARVDFTPLAGVVLIFLLLHLLPSWVLGTLDKHNLTLWPQ
jgi:uncharacterized protein YggT (Ycf19 family)